MDDTLAQRAPLASGELHGRASWMYSEPYLGMKLPKLAHWKFQVMNSKPNWFLLGLCSGTGSLTLFVSAVFGWVVFLHSFRVIEQGHTLKSPGAVTEANIHKSPQTSVGRAELDLKGSENQGDRE